MDSSGAGAGTKVHVTTTTVIDVMASALLLACPQGYLRVFADEGAQVGVLLGRLVAAQRDEAPPRDQAWWSR